jgi:proteasome lid subunit RPN8/RPN11
MNGSSGKASLKVWGNPENSKVVIYIDRQAYDAIFRHGAVNPKREVVGILLGNVSEESTDRYRVDIVGIVKSDFAPGNQTQAQFTHEVWLQLVESAQREYPSQKVVGWYHTHPGFGAFMSDDDVNSHRVAFSHPWHVAAVCDPIKNELCFFGWDGPEIKAIQGFYTYEIPVKKPEPLARPERVAPQSNMPALLIPVLAIFLVLFTVLGLTFTVWLPGEQKKEESSAPAMISSLSVSKDFIFWGTTMDTIPVQLSFTGEGNISWQLLSNPSWIKLEVDGIPIENKVLQSINASNPVTINVTPLRTGLEPGDYQGEITFSYGNSGELKVPTFMAVAAPVQPPTAPLPTPTFQIISVKDTGGDNIIKGNDTISVWVRNIGDVEGKAEVTVDEVPITFSDPAWEIIDLPPARLIPAKGEPIEFMFRLEPKKKRSGAVSNFIFKVWIIDDSGKRNNTEDDSYEQEFKQP